MDDQTRTYSWQGFEPIYRAEIAPKTEALEATRKSRLKDAYSRAAISAVIALGVPGLVYLQTEALAWRATLAIVLVVVLGLIGFIWTGRLAASQGDDLRALVVPPLQAFLGGLEYHRKPGDRFDIERFRNTGVVGSFRYRRSKFEDLFIGRHRGTSFLAVEARLRQRQGKRHRTVFRGLLFDIEVPDQFAGTVLMVRDLGALVSGVADFVRKAFTGLARIEVGHPAFEARYQVYGEDGDEARKLLVPAFLDTMVALADQAGERALNAAFSDGRFLLALPVSRDLFEIGKLHRSLDHLEDDLRALLKQFTIAHRLIDHLHGERPELLPRD